MATGERFSTSQQAALERALTRASEGSGLRFAATVGPLAGERTDVQAALAAAGHLGALDVVVAVDPAARRVEVLTGAQARIRLDDETCGLAVLAMVSSFAAGDLAGGLRNGVTLLGEHARAPRTLHADQP